MQKDTKYCIRCRKRVAGDCYGYKKEKSVCNDNRVQEEQPGAYPGGRVPQFPGAGKGTVHCKNLHTGHWKRREKYRRQVGQCPMIMKQSKASCYRSCVSRVLMGRYLRCNRKQLPYSRKPNQKSRSQKRIR